MKILILAGGDGTRLWPLSTQIRPKQFLTFPFGEQKHSLLCNTIFRILQKGCSLEDIFIVTWNSYYNQVLQEIETTRLAIPHNNIICEPFKRNTAPAIALSTQYILENAACTLNEVILILPSDQLIENSEDFTGYLEEAEIIAEQGYIVTLGVPPTQAETGYGYIETYQEYEHHSWLKVKAFTEKPDRCNALKYIKSQRHLWNSGILAMTIRTLMGALHEFESDLYNFIKSGYDSAISHYSELINKSFDYAVMERAANIAVIPMRLTWSDLGSWNNIYDHLKKNTEGNAIHGEQPICLQSNNNLVWNETGRQHALIGLSDLIIVDTPDSLLIARKKDSQAIKSITSKLNEFNKTGPALYCKQESEWGHLIKLNNFLPLTNILSIFQIFLKPNKLIALKTSPLTHAIYIGKGYLMDLSTRRVYHQGEQIDLQNSQSQFSSICDEGCHLIIIGEAPTVKESQEQKGKNSIEPHKIKSPIVNCKLIEEPLRSAYQ